MRENIDDISGLATYDFRDYNQKRYTNITKLVARKFNLKYIGAFLNEKDRQQQKFELGTKSINIGWEFMVGYVIYSNNIHSNTLAKEIAEHVHEKYG